MAFFAPIAAGLATVGGGSAVAGGLMVASLGLGAASAYQSYKAGKITEAEYKLQAKAEGDQARAREIERKRALLSSLASQNAYAAAGGAEMSGSLAAIAKRDIQDSRNDLLADKASTGTAQRILRSRGSSANAAGQLGAVRSLVDSGVSAYGMRG